MPFDALRFFLPGFFVLFVLGIFNPTCPANAQSQSGQARTTPARQYPAAKRGLNFSVGPRGLDSLSFNGQSLLASPESGELQPQKSVFRAVLDALVPRSSPRVATPNKQADTVDLSYPWGRISCAYGKQDDRLTMRLEVSNTSSEPLNEFSLRLMELNFPSIPHGGTLEAGMFGFGFKGPEWPLHRIRFPFRQLPIRGLLCRLSRWITGPVRSIFAVMIWNVLSMCRSRRIPRPEPAIR